MWICTTHKRCLLPSPTISLLSDPIRVLLLLAIQGGVVDVLQDRAVDQHFHFLRSAVRVYLFRHSQVQFSAVGAIGLSNLLQLNNSPTAHSSHPAVATDARWVSREATRPSTITPPRRKTLIRNRIVQLDTQKSTIGSVTFCARTRGADSRKSVPISAPLPGLVRTTSRH